jgi:hypothetical protein
MAFLPAITFQPPPPPPVFTRRVNAPYFGNGVVNYGETAIFWFGRAYQASNYADVRVGYNNSELYIQVLVFDRRLWYDADPTPARLTDWDSASLYLRVGGNSGSAPDANTYRFDAQINDWENTRTQWQAAYRGNGSGWSSNGLAFTTQSGYKWESASVGGMNTDNNNRGWLMTYHIPFSSLGLSAPSPVQAALWGVGVVVHDRDDAGGAPIADQVWPETFNASQPATWGQLRFGIPTYQQPTARSPQLATIRNGLNGATVVDAAVGGTLGNLCASDPAFIWNTWGNATFGGAERFNIQNQGDISDWPCFSKVYINFPLSAIPAGKVVISASLTLHEWGGSDPTQAQSSYIQISSLADNWDPYNLSWNNAPLAAENMSGAWVDVFRGQLVWPGQPYTWDVSRAVAQAYANGQSLRLVFYESDWDYHSGKYFVGSQEPDWNAAGRPTLRVMFGNP